MTTKVISLFGGPGIGKDLTAAKLFYDLKRQKIRTEYVQEIAKDWARENKEISPLEAFVILGRQIEAESKVYGKNTVVITSSPVWLSAFYDIKFNQSDAILFAVQSFYYRAKKQNVNHYNIFLTRGDYEYEVKDRFQTEVEAKQIDWELRTFAKLQQLPLIEVDSGDTEKIQKLCGIG